MKRFGGLDAIWSLVALAGVVVIITTATSDDVSNIKGDLLAVGAMFAWSAYFVASKQSKGKVTPTEFTAGTALWTALIVTPLGFAFGQDMTWPTWTNWGLLAAMSIGSGIIGHVLMNWSLVRIPLWVGSTFTLLIPVFSAIIAWVFLDEVIVFRQALGIGGGNRFARSDRPWTVSGRQICRRPSRGPQPGRIGRSGIMVAIDPDTMLRERRYSRLGQRVFGLSDDAFS